jgi:hypothetical protein
MYGQISKMSLQNVWTAAGVEHPKHKMSQNTYLDSDYGVLLNRSLNQLSATHKASFKSAPAIVHQLIQSFLSAMVFPAISPEKRRLFVMLLTLECHISLLMKLNNNYSIIMQETGTLENRQKVI